MNIIEINKRFPTHDDCIKYLEEVRWKNKPKCPYCQSTNQTPLKQEKRYHCNNCNTSYSVTVGTIFHKTRLDLQKWFLAITLILNARKGISARQLARDLEVNKNTAWYMAMRIRKAMFEHRELLQGIVEMDETYVGGRKFGGKRGRGTTKFKVVGMAERGGKIKAQSVKAVNSRTLNTLVKENVDINNAVVMTDEFMGYYKLKNFVEHKQVDHRVWYVDKDIHTNSVESFWSLFKRGITGQYHKVSIRYLPKYIDEFCYRHNNRENPDIFDLTIINAVRSKH